MSIIIEEESREDLIIQIKHLITVTGEAVDINSKILDYFQYNELKDIRDNLRYKKTHQDDITADYLVELYEELSDY